MEASVNEKNTRFSQSSDEIHISNLVYSALNRSKEHLLRPADPEWIEQAGAILVQHCLSKNFDHSVALQELLDLGFKRETIIDHCIPIAAVRLGEAWVNDSLSFCEVTLGSSNLQNLLKEIIQDEITTAHLKSGQRYLICVHQSEQHTLGALVLGDILRRRGHSLKIKLNATSSEICELQEANEYDGIFFSSASYLSVKETADCVREIRKYCNQKVPIFLGGSNIDKISQGVDLSGFDLVTNSLDAVTEYVENKRKREINILNEAAQR